MKKNLRFLTMPCFFVFLALGSTQSFADQILDLQKGEIEAVNAVLRAPQGAQALLNCPRELSAMSRSGAVIVGGRVFTSRFGVMHVFEFANGANKASLQVRSTTQSLDGTLLDPSQLECTLTDISNH